MNRILSFIIILFCPYALSAAQLWVEAEQFENIGGWTIDSQFIDQMGSAYLLAHGLGAPVKPATTIVKFNDLHKYHIWVRTKDWAPYPKGPGKFSISIANKTLPITFGQDGNSEWHWVYGESIDIKQHNIKIQLNDLTGFEGRIDAIYFSTSKIPPPSNLKKLNLFRRKMLKISDSPQKAGTFDVVIVGGGISGLCAAIQASKYKLKVALLQDRPILGGNNSSEIRIPMNGDMSKNLYPKLGSIVKTLSTGAKSENGPDTLYGDNLKFNMIQKEKNISLFLMNRVYRVLKDTNSIKSVITKNVITNKELIFYAPIFVDCTGDGNLGYLAGAKYKMGRESFKETKEPKAPQISDNMTMGTTNHWFAELEKGTSEFPICPWAVQFQPQYYANNMASSWYWESGFYDDKIKDAEAIRDYNFRVNYGYWSFLKNYKKKETALWKLKWMAYVSGKRESRRLLGDIFLTELDIDNRVKYPDACITTTWGIDLHYPDPKNSQYYPHKEFWGIADHNRNFPPYHIPYRCLYSINIANMFMAGRDISVSHVALGTVRVMNTCGMMGEVVGKAVFLCRKYNCLPRDIYEKHLNELLSLCESNVYDE